MPEDRRIGPDSSNLPQSDGAAEANALQHAVGIRALNDQHVWRLCGDDVHHWLQGQVTADVRTLQPGGARYALALQSAGRIISDLWILQPRLASPDGQLWLVVPERTAPMLLQTLKSHLVSEDVEIAEQADVAVLSLQGPRAADLSAMLGLEPTPLVDASSEPIAGVLGAYPCDRLGVGGIDVLVRGDALAELRDRCLALAAGFGGVGVSELGWELARLRLGVPLVGVDFGDRTLPHEAGLVERAVAFGKGCYVGQEAVNMIEHRGKSPRHLVRLSVEATTVPASQTPLIFEDGSVAGMLTSAIVDPELPGRILALGYVKRGYVEPGTRLAVAGMLARIEAKA